MPVYLPPEILLNIVRFLDGYPWMDGRDSGRDHESKTLQNLRLVDRTFRDFATPYLFQRILLPWYHEDARIRMIDLAESGYLQYLRDLLIPVEIMLPKDFVDASDTISSQEASIWAANLLIPLYTFLSACPSRLDRLTLGQIGTYHGVYELYAEDMDFPTLAMEPHNLFFKMIGSMFHQDKNVPAVGALDIYLCRISSANQLWSPTLLESVNSVRIFVQGENLGEIFDDQELGSVADDVDDFLSYMTRCQQLECLWLCFDDSPMRYDCEFFKPHSTINPNLKQLSLSNLTLFSDHPMFHDFITEMQKLELLDLEFLSFAYSETGSYWKDIFDALATLPSLLTLGLTMLHYSDVNDGIEVYADWRNGRIPHRPLHSPYAEDYVALRGLLRAIIAKPGAVLRGGNRKSYARDLMQPLVLYPLTPINQ